MAALVSALAVNAPAFAQDQGQLFTTQEEGFGRLILNFPSLDKLPAYRMRIENGVLSLEFDGRIEVVLPDVAVTMPDYLSVARVDPDGRGLRIGLKSGFTFNRIEAGEKLFIDLMPVGWQGMPPPLPQEIIEELAERARVAAIQAEQDRKARMAAELNPQVKLRVGRNATFLRVQFDWTVPTDGTFQQVGDLGVINFEWPITADVSDLASALPEEIISVESGATADGGIVSFLFGEGVQPRFMRFLLIPMCSMSIWQA